jgi:ribosomal protein S19
MRALITGPYFVAFPSLPNALKNNKPIYTKARACTILPNHIGVEFQVHNGKDYIPVKVTEDMVGYKLGEFAATRKKFSYRYVHFTQLAALKSKTQDSGLYGSS